MKSRSASACIKEGYGLYTKNFRKTMSSSWLTALLYSLVCSALCTILTAYLPETITQTMAARATNSALPANGIVVAAVILALIIIGGLFEIATYSCVIAQLKDEFGSIRKVGKWKLPALDRTTFVRTLIATVANMLIVMVLLAIIVIPTGMLLGMPSGAGDISTKSLIVIALELIAIMMLVLPMAFVSMKYIIRTDTRLWRLIATDYKVGLKHFGFILIVSVVSCIVICLAEYVLALPASILTTANYQANIGVYYGDPLGMPGYINYISAVVFFIAGFIQIYIRISALFTSYYMYGSIEQQEEERRKFKESGMNQSQISMLP